MRATEIAARLEGFRGRVAGSDAERRAANWLAEGLASATREVVVEPFWCRPNWALAHGWHVALALAGSLVSVASGPVGAGLVVLALVSIFADELLGVSIGRRLTPERASQNVVALQTNPTRAESTLLIAANYDAGHTGFVYRGGLRRATARLKAVVHGLTPGWLGWLVLAATWLLVIAVLRATGDNSHLIGAIQLLPTVVLLFAFALLIELALSEPSPAAGDNGSGVAAAVDLVRALDIAPPRHLHVEVVLGGAGDGAQLGIRKHLRARRRELKARNTVVLGMAACAEGAPRWWTSDGALLPLRFAKPLRQLAADVAADEAYLNAAPHAGRGTSPAFAARRRRLPAMTIGCLDGRDLVPRSHQVADTAARIEPAAIENAVQYALILVDAIDSFVGRQTAHVPA
jgi:hypothetical protein